MGGYTYRYIDRCFLVILFVDLHIRRSSFLLFSNFRWFYLLVLVVLVSHLFKTLFSQLLDYISKCTLYENVTSIECKMLLFWSVGTYLAALKFHLHFLLPNSLLPFFFLSYGISANTFCWPFMIMHNNNRNITSNFKRKTIHMDFRVRLGLTVRGSRVWPFQFQWFLLRFLSLTSFILLNI